MLKQSMFAALAVIAAVAVPALAQQVLPGDEPMTAQAQQRAEGEDTARDEGGRRWRREPRGEERGERPGRRFGDRERMGPEMMRERMARMCDRQGGRFGDRMLERLERATQPTAEQKPKFDQLKEAATKAAAIVKAACPSEPSFTPTGRLASAEKRLTAMLEAIRTVRPAMDAYYNSLSDEQKARLSMSRRAMGPRGERHGEWGGMERGEPRDGHRGRRFGRDENRQDEQRGERGDRTTYDADTAAPEPL
jgi:LTXXQ motif family protein